ncbi:MAG TPA: winged helix-turn-helix domain-containing protein [Steroidobacteraceae bacterium]|nr:winged helix-turn-helix domain-containing protein [Steroidobacteraceae bacterium]
MAPAGKQALRIGDWRINPALDEISRDGATIKIEPRAMQVLLCLAGSPGEVFSVEQLLDTVWRDLVVTPDSVYQAIATLRRALGDDQKEHAYIVNVARRGYRLVAPVSAWGDAGSPSAPSLTITDTNLPNRTRRRVALLATLVVMSVGALVALSLVWWKHHAAAGGSGETPPSRAPSVAVLPFADLSDQKDQQYLADGLAEEIIDRLSQMSNLRVLARTSSFYFRDKQVTVPEIARTLGVQQVLEGSVRKSGDALRISARLVRVADGFDIWTRTYDRPLADVFNIEDEIAAAVVQTLRATTLEHWTGEPAAHTDNTEAYSLYLRAIANQNTAGAAEYEMAIEQLKAALVLDPRFASAWASIAMVEIWKFDYRFVDPDPATCTRARAAAQRALELSPQAAQSHRAMGTVLQHCGRDFAGAERQYRRAMQLNPQDALAMRSYAWMCVDTGKCDDSLVMARKALAIDPLNAWSYVTVGDVAWTVGQLQEAERAYRKAVELQPDGASMHAILAHILIGNHKAAEAVEQAEKEPDAEFRMEVLPFALDAAGRRSEADRAIAQFAAGWLERNPAAPWMITLFYACRHDSDQAIHWLTVYAERHTGSHPTPPEQEECEKFLQSDPRYPAIWKRALR